MGRERRDRAQAGVRERRRIAILGAAGLGRAFFGALESHGQANQVIGFLDDGRREPFCGRPVLGRCRELPALAKQHGLTHVALGIGYQYCEDRRALIQLVNDTRCCEWQTAVHASAVVSPQAALGQGVFIGMGSLVNAGSRIGDYGVLWSGVIIEHDNDIGDDVYLTTGVMTAGYVTIKSRVFVGMGSMIARSTIGEGATIGAGSLVLEDVPPHVYAWGRPAKIVKEKPEPAHV